MTDFKHKRFWQHPLWLLAVQLGALWPHWVWVARRTVDGSDEPWGVLALLTIVALVVVQRRQMASLPAVPTLLAASLLSLAATLGINYLSPMIAAAIAVLAVATLLSGILPRVSNHSALAVLALLALPLTASLNFYLGYPLRWLCAQGASAIIGAAGWQTTPEGATLIWNGKTILVDAPCAGIAMLWIGIYTAALLSYLYRVSVLRTGINLIAASILVLAGNMLRNALLFFKEAGIAALPDWTHEGIGLLVFGLLFCVLFQIISWRLHAPR